MRSWVIYNAQLVLPDRVCSGSVSVREGIIDQVSVAQHCANKSGLNMPNEAAHVPGWEVDLQGDFLIPGLLDTHVHGSGSSEAMEGEESVASLGKSLLSQGTTAFLPTVMSCAPHKLAEVLASIGAVRLAKDIGGAEILGVHLEGPFLSPAYLGAQAWVQPEGEDVGWFKELVARHPGLVRILTLAPERVEAGELICYCAANGIIPSSGHTSAGYEIMERMLGQGLNHVTHLFNAMPGIHHRAPGLVAKALLDPGIWVEVIADGVHIHPAIIELVMRLKPARSICLVSDEIQTVGRSRRALAPEVRAVAVENGVARLDNGTIAGGTCSLLTGVKNLVEKLNLPLFSAVNYASLNPARLLGVEDRLGSIALGKEATFVRLSREFAVKQVWVKGRPA